MLLVSYEFFNYAIPFDKEYSEVKNKLSRYKNNEEMRKRQFFRQLIQKFSYFLLNLFLIVFCMLHISIFLAFPLLYVQTVSVFV